MRVLEVNHGAFQTREEIGEALVGDFMAAWVADVRNCCTW